MTYPPSKVTIACAVVMLVLVALKQPGSRNIAMPSFPLAQGQTQSQPIPASTPASTPTSAPEGGCHKPTNPLETILVKMGDCL